MVHGVNNPSPHAMLELGRQAIKWVGIIVYEPTSHLSNTKALQKCEAQIFLHLVNLTKKIQDPEVV